jgi:SAM-dependent methyltransferase
MPQIPERNMQRPLSSQLDLCVLEGSILRPCGYHANRAHSSTFGITKQVLEVESGELGYTGSLVPHRELENLAGLLQKGDADPAGGWYLVKEQREWLEARLFDILEPRQGSGETIRILEAGVASFVHHYTYLAILKSVLDRLEDPPRLAVTVVDKCVFPILQIAAVERALAAGIRRPRRLDIGGQQLFIEGEFLDVMNPSRRDFGRISLDLWVRNLGEMEAVAQLGKFDVITEHFLTAVLDQQIEQITSIRQTYARILKPGGYLLCATGIVKKSPNYEEYVQLHPRLGFRSIDAKTLFVWDPYGFAREELVDFSLGRRSEKLAFSLDNTLTAYWKEH